MPHGVTIWQQTTRKPLALPPTWGKPMHELSLAENAVELMAAAAAREGFTRVHVLRLQVGALSCVDPDALRFALEVATQHTCAQGARVEISSEPGLGLCPQCGRTSVMESLYDLCPHCSGVPLQVQQGTTLRIQDLEVE